MNEQFFTSLNGYKVKDEYAIHTYDTVANMKNDTKLKSGMHVKTKGYYNANDCGNAEYLIRNKSNNDIEDNSFIHFIGDSLVAELIIENNINIRQLGARSQDKNNNKYDIKSYIDKYFNYISSSTNRLKLYIPAGVWYTSQVNITNKNGFDIYGDYGFSDFDHANSTIISSYNNNQDCIFNIGSSNNIIENFSISNIIFTTKEFVANNDNGFTYSSHKNILKQCLNLLYCSYGKLDNIFFQGVDGQCLKISSCWEIYSNNLNFRGILNDEGSILCFGKRDTTLLEYSNISACYFEYIMFEAIHGNLIEFEEDCNFTNNHFGTINFEDSELPSADSTYTIFTNENIENFDEDTAIHYAILQNVGGIRETIIDSIELNNFSYRYRTKNEINYVYDTILNISSNNIQNNIIINNINVSGMNKNARIIKQNNYYPKRDTKFILNNILNTSSKDFWYDLNGYNYINSKAELKGINVNDDYNTSFNLIKFSGAIPFYEIVRHFNEYGKKGFLYYDENSQTPNKLIVKPYNESNNISKVCCNTIVTGTSLMVRAKIPNGDTFRLALITPNHTTPFDMLGTGEYKIYTIDVSSLNIGDVVNMRGSTNSVGIDCNLDYFKFY